MGNAVLTVRRIMWCCQRERERFPWERLGISPFFSFTISISSHCKCWLAHIGGGVEHLWGPQELYMLFTFKFSENYGIFALYTAERNCADKEMWSTQKTRLNWFQILRPVHTALTDDSRHFIRFCRNSVLYGWAIWPKSYITLWVILFLNNVMIYITILLCFMISNYYINCIK